MAQSGPRGCEMKKIRVNARAIVGDIKEHVGLKSLMEKHGMSYRHLLKVKEVLGEKGWVTRGELDYLNPADAVRGNNRSGQRLSGLLPKPT